MGALSESVRRLGFWSAVVAAVTSITYSVFAILQVMGVTKPPWDGPLLFAPSIVLAWAFLVLMVSVHYAVPVEKRIWTQVGLAFALLYAAFVSLVYFVQLFVVTPYALRGEVAQVAVLAFTAGSFMVAIDALGYGFMSLATLFAAPAFTGQRLARWIRGLFLANGVLALPIVAAFVVPPLVFVGALWMVTIPASTILLAVYFRRAERMAT